MAAMKMCQPGEEHMKKHYDDLKERPFFPDLIKFSCSGPVIAMVWEGDSVIATCRKMIGATSHVNRDPGTIRGALSNSTRFNGIHASDSVESAQAEIALWFKDEELVSYVHHSEKWVYENPKLVPSEYKMNNGLTMPAVGMGTV